MSRIKSGVSSVKNPGLMRDMPGCFDNPQHDRVESQSETTPDLILRLYLI